MRPTEAGHTLRATSARRLGHRRARHEERRPRFRSPCRACPTGREVVRRTAALQRTTLRGLAFRTPTDRTRDADRRRHRTLRRFPQRDHQRPRRSSYPSSRATRPHRRPSRPSPCAISRISGQRILRRSSGLCCTRSARSSPMGLARAPDGRSELLTDQSNSRRPRFLAPSAPKCCCPADIVSAWCRRATAQITRQVSRTSRSGTPVRLSASRQSCHRRRSWQRVHRPEPAAGQCRLRTGCRAWMTWSACPRLTHHW